MLNCCEEPPRCWACAECCGALGKTRPELPPRALANDLWAGPLPAELRGLTRGERLFVARAYTFKHLRTATKMGDPEARQKVQQGNVISFPHSAELVLHQLPLRVESMADYISVYFTGPDSEVAKE